MKGETAKLVSDGKTHGLPIVLGLRVRAPSAVPARRRLSRPTGPICTGSGVIPSLGPMEEIAAHWDAYSSWCSTTSRPARSFTSAGYLVCVCMSPSSQRLEPPGKPGRSRH